MLLKFDTRGGAGGIFRKKVNRTWSRQFRRPENGEHLRKVFDGFFYALF